MANMKKLNLIVSHSDMVNVLSELIELECVEPTEPVLTLDPPELSDLLNREVMELENYDANFEDIVLLSTQYTYFLTGWLPAEYEPELTAALSRFMCAWAITDLSPDEVEAAPVLLRYPQLFAKMRSGGRRVFVPLSKSFVS